MPELCDCIVLAEFSVRFFKIIHVIFVFTPGDTQTLTGDSGEAQRNLATPAQFL